MRGFSLLALILGMLLVGYMVNRSIEQHVPTEPGRKTTSDQIENQVRDTLQKYQKKLDKQAENN